MELWNALSHQSLVLAEPGVRRPDTHPPPAPNSPPETWEEFNAMSFSRVGALPSAVGCYSGCLWCPCAGLNSLSSGWELCVWSPPQPPALPLPFLPLYWTSSASPGMPQLCPSLPLDWTVAHRPPAIHHSCPLSVASALSRTRSATTCPCTASSSRSTTRLLARALGGC